MSPTRTPNDLNLAALTPRELQVLEIMATGARDRDIADRLGIKIATVKLHLHRVYTKLNVSNRTHATRKYLDHQHHTTHPRRRKQPPR
jgi:DNA-binding NarL/FixJ family response regulator